MRNRRCTDRTCHYCFPKGYQDEAWAWPYALALLLLIGAVAFWLIAVAPGATP